MKAAVCLNVISLSAPLRVYLSTASTILLQRENAPIIKHKRSVASILSFICNTHICLSTVVLGHKKVHPFQIDGVRKRS